MAYLYAYCRNYAETLTGDSRSKQLLQVVPEQQFVPGDLKFWAKEQSTSDPTEDLIWQSILVSCTSLCSHHLRKMKVSHNVKQCSESP